jgi:hypothetical protein
MSETIRIVRAVQTAMGCPSQWDLWDTDDNYYYARYRHGCGELRRYKTENWWNASRSADGGNSEYLGTVASFQNDDQWDGFISLDEFAVRTGIELDPGIYEIGYGDHVRDELIKGGMVMFLEIGDNDTDTR